MASVNRDNSAAQTVLATRAEYKPLDSSSMDESFRWARNTAYKEAQEKQARKRADLDQLAAIDGLGLPKQMQGELNYDKEQLVGKIRKGDLEVGSYEYKAAVQGILGKYKQMNEVVDMGKKAIAGDNFLIEKDENGNYIDNKSRFKQEFNTLYENDFDPKAPPFEQVGYLRGQVANMTGAMDMDVNNIVSTIDKWNSMNSSQQVEFMAGSGMIGKEVTTNYTPQQLRDAFRDSLIKENNVSLIQKYTSSGAKANGVPYEDFAKQYIGSMMPVNTRSEELTDDTTKIQSEITRRALFPKGGKTVPFELTTVTVNDEVDGVLTPTDYSMWGAGDETIDGIKVAGVVWKDGKLLPKTVDFGVTDDSSLAINYINKKNADFGEGEKVTQQDIIARLKNTKAEERGFNQEIFDRVDIILSNRGGFFDNEDDALKTIFAEFNLLTTGKDGKMSDFAKEVKAKLDSIDFDDEVDRKSFSDFLKERLPETMTRAKEGQQVTQPTSKDEEVTVSVAEQMRKASRQ